MPACSDHVGAAFVDQFALLDDHIIRAGLHHIIGRDAAQHPFGQGRDNSPPSTAAVAVDRAVGAAVDQADDAILGHVHQTARQIARVRRLQRRVRQALRARGWS